MCFGSCNKALWAWARWSETHHLTPCLQARTALLCHASPECCGVAGIQVLNTSRVTSSGMQLMLYLPRALLGGVLKELHTSPWTATTAWTALTGTRCLSAQSPPEQGQEQQQDNVQATQSLPSASPHQDDTGVQVAAAREQHTGEVQQGGELSNAAAHSDDNTLHSAPTTPAPRLRSLADIFQTSDMAALMGAPQQDDLDYLASTQTPARQQSGAETAPGPSGQPARPGDRLVSQRYGYAAISGAVPKDGRPTDNLLGGTHPRLLPRRMFQPGQTYLPEELNPYAPQLGTARQRRAAAAPPHLHEVQLLADYKNVGFLENYLTQAGKLVSRKASRLPIRSHIKVMREIKRARAMAFIAGEARPDKRHLKALRETEARMQQQAVGSSSLPYVG